MARLLFTVWPFPTHLHPFFAVALEARRRGHQAAFYTGGPGVALAEREGFACYPFYAVDWDPVARTVDDLIAGRRNPSQMRRLWPRFLAETVPAQVRDLDAILARWPADVLVCDIAMWAPILILFERDKIPVAPFSHVAHCILPGPDGPLPGFALPRRRRRREKIVAAMASLGSAWITARTRRRANRLRHQFGLGPVRTGVNEFTGTLPLYLVPSAPELDGNRSDLPPSVHYVGSCLWEPGNQPPPPPIAHSADRPCVLVDEGALFTREPRVLELAARGLSDLPVSVVLLAGEGRDWAKLNLGPLPPNAMVMPHTALSGWLPLAAALVTNGNSESVLAGLHAGLPLVVLPSIWDQAEMAWRVHETGVGLRVPPRRTTPQQLRVAVQRVLQEPAFRKDAAAMGQVLGARGGPARAVDLLEDHLGRP